VRFPGEIARYVIFAFQGYELPLQERLAEGSVASPGVDAVPFGAGFLPGPLILQARAGGEVEDSVFVLVLRGLCFCILSGAADQDHFVEHASTDHHGDDWA
jgi:hypothetical protein